MLLVCFLLGGIYIIASIRSATSELESAVRFHSIQDLSNEIQHSVKLLQGDLALLESGNGTHLQTVRSHIDSLKEQVADAFRQEPFQEIQQQPERLQSSVDAYSELLLEILALPKGSPELPELKTKAQRQGERLLSSLQSLATKAGKNLTGRSKLIFRDITKVTHLISFLVIVGPLAILIMTALFLNRFTNSIGVLVDASSVLKEGNLDYHIDGGLQHEFKHLADSFNSMSQALKEERDALQSIRHLYQTLFESAGEGIFILDLEPGNEGRIIAANKAAAQMHDYSVEELQQMRIQDVSCDGGCSERLDVAVSGGWSAYTVERMKKNKTRFVAEVSVGLLDLENKKYALLFSRDVTQRKKEEAELQRANQMALVGEMAAGLAHEIKNPLAGIKVSLEVLADELELGEEDQELFTRVINETNRVEKLLKALLSYARPPELQYEHFDLNKLLDNSVKNIALTGKTSSRQGVEIEKHYAENLPELEADSGQLQQVMLNIFLNAIESMPEGGRIIVSTRMRDESSVEVRIVDTGKGISEDVMANIFQPFFTTKSKGTGLGLAICKRIIEEHGGTIEATAHSAGGTQFTMTLPLQPKRQDILL